MHLSEIRNLPEDTLLELLVSSTNELLAAKSLKASNKELEAKRKQIEAIQLIIASKKLPVSTSTTQN
jgi:hypothetical protein